MTGSTFHNHCLQDTHALHAVFEEGMGSMPAAKLVVAELGLVAAAEADLELGPVPATKPVPLGPLPVEPSWEGSADREETFSL